MSYIKFKNVSKKYKFKDNENSVLNNISFDINKNEIVIINGKTGSGKTTILNLLCGFEKSDDGTIIVNNILVNKLNKKNLTNYIKDYVGYVSFDDELIESESVLENILIAFNLADEKIDAEKLIDKLELTNLLNYYPKELNKTEKIKVTLARALCKNPKMLILDEIFLNMDKKDVKKVLKVTTSFAKKNKIPLIITCFDSKFNPYTNKVIYIKNKKIEKIKVNQKVKPIGEFK